MERFAADAIKAERTAYIKADIKANVPWTDLAERYGLTHAEIEQVVLDSAPNAQRRGSALIVRSDEPSNERR